MIIKIAEDGEALSTDLAHVRSLSCVESPVHLEVIFFRKEFPTDVTRKSEHIVRSSAPKILIEQIYVAILQFPFTRIYRVAAVCI